MNWTKPPIEQVWQAVEVYLKAAYAEGKPPTAVMQRLETLRSTPADGFFECPVFERHAKNPGLRYAIRMGNKVYPHMKLVIEPAPGGGGCLFRADTHDRHIRPAPTSREYKAFCELMEMNQAFAEQIETEWARCGIPTFKQFLRQDLLQRTRAPSDAAPDRSEGTS